MYHISTNWLFTENIFSYRSSVRFKINGHCRYIAKCFAISFRVNKERDCELLFSIGDLSGK